MIGRPIHYVARTVPGYRVPILERLNQALSGRLVVFHGRPPSSSARGVLTGPDISFASVELRNRWFRGEGVHFQSPVPPLRGSVRPAAILAEESPRSISLPVLMAAASARGVPVVLWGHFSSNDRPFSTVNAAYRYRLFLAHRADACVCYSQEIVAQLERHIPAERLFVAPNTLDMDVHDGWKRRLMEEGRTAVRRRLGIPEHVSLLAYIGRLESDKRAELLPEIASRVGKRRPAGLVIIGDGSDRESIREALDNNSIQYSHMTGTLSAREAAPYLFASDAMILPGRVGLAVNHAFAYDLPVITRVSPHGGRYHGPEVSYLDDGVNSRMTEDASAAGFAEAALDVLGDLESYRNAARAIAETRMSPTAMIYGLTSAIRSVIRDD